MPEGDTVLRTASRLDAALRGALVERTDLRWARYATVDFTGETTLGVHARGKHLLHRFSDGRTLHTHLRMEGQWRLAPAGPDADAWARRADLRALVGTAEWVALGLRLGVVDVVSTAEESRVVGHLGPDVLDPGWDRVVALDNLRRASDRGAPVGAALLDQRNVCGIGTFWASEALFLEQVPPWRPAAADTLERVLRRVRPLMQRAAQTGIQTSTGDAARDRQAFVHARSGRPCRRCGDTVRVAMIGSPPQDRTMFYCPTCQDGLAPGDDGRRQSPLGSAGGRRRTRRERGR